MAQIDSSPRESSSVFTALLMSSSVLNFAGLKTSKLAKSPPYGVVRFTGGLGIRAKEIRWYVDGGGEEGYWGLSAAWYSRKWGTVRRT